MAEDSYFSREGARIAYQYRGSGAPVGYAHGVPLSRSAVRRLELFDLDALGRGRRMLTYDQRGHGRSTGLPLPEHYHFENFAADLLALLDFLDPDEPMDFAGSSLGSDCALRAAIAAPHRFRRLALLIPPASWEEGRQAKQWYFDTADEIEADGVAAWRERAAQAGPLPIFDGYPQFDIVPDVDETLLPAVLRGVGASELPRPDALAGIRHPTMILAWDTDPLHPLSTAERLHDVLPNSTLHVARSVQEIKGWTDLVTDFFS